MFKSALWPCLIVFHTPLLPSPPPLRTARDLIPCQGKGGHVLNRSYTTFEGGALFYGGYAETGGALGIEDGVVT